MIEAASDVEAGEMPASAQVNESSQEVWVMGQIRKQPGQWMLEVVRDDHLGTVNQRGMLYYTRPVPLVVRNRRYLAGALAGAATAGALLGWVVYVSGMAAHRHFKHQAAWLLTSAIFLAACAFLAAAERRLRRERPRASELLWGAFATWVVAAGLATGFVSVQFSNAYPLLVPLCLALCQLVLAAMSYSCCGGGDIFTLLLNTVITTLITVPLHVVWLLWVAEPSHWWTWPLAIAALPTNLLLNWWVQCVHQRLLASPGEAHVVLRGLTAVVTDAQRVLVGALTCGCARREPIPDDVCLSTDCYFCWCNPCRLMRLETMFTRTVDPRRFEGHRRTPTHSDGKTKPERSPVTRYPVSPDFMQRLTYEFGDGIYHPHDSYLAEVYDSSAGMLHEESEDE